MFSGRSEALSTGFANEMTRSLGGKMKNQDTEWSREDGVAFGKLGNMRVSDHPLAKNPAFGVLARCSNPGCDWR